MMSSEEEADSHAPYSDRLLKKQKRARQRVDAGEPRNSYSTLATNGLAPARTAHMSGGLYGAIFEGRQHFGLFGTGYAPAEMLNELLGRTPKQEDISDEPPAGEIAHRVLRDILQNHKKEFLGLSTDNNNVLANNNNDEPKQKRSPERPTSRDSRPDLDDALLALDSAGESPTTPPSAPMPSETLLNPKSEPEDRDSDALRSSPRPLDPMKRARVENIVSTMRSSPAPQQPQVNGCKKRKLYQPQQHDGAAERYGNSHGSSAHTVSDDSDDEGEQPPIQQKLVEKNALRSQLRTMQEQLAEMQEKYLELRNRMGQESETVDNDGNSSDVEQTDDRVPKSEPASPAKEVPPPIPNSTPNVLSMMNKMMSVKMHGHGVGHPHLPHGPFNGALPMMPHIAPSEHMHPPHPHQHLNSAAAMYLNVSQKLFLENEARMKEAAEQQQQNNQQQQRPQSNQHSPQQRQLGPTPKPPMSTELAERLDALRVNAGSVGPVSGADLEGLADVLKNEITASLATLIDSIVTRFVHQRRILGKQSEAAAAAAEQLNKHLMRASRLLDKTSPTPKPPERPPVQMPGSMPVHHPSAPNGVPSFITHNQMLMNQMNGPRAPTSTSFQMQSGDAGGLGHNNHVRHPAGMFQTPPKSLASLYTMNGHFEREPNPEQNEALSLVVTPKKKRQKVTDTRITPRTVSRILGEGVGHSPESKFPESPSPRPYPGGLALPTSVAIANPSLHESQVFSPYSPFFGAGAGLARSPPTAPERESPPLPHVPALVHPALLAAVHHASPDYLSHHHAHVPHHGGGSHHLKMDPQDPHSDCNSTELPFDGMPPTSSTLTPMHLRKAKLMFFWVRYPSSAVLKMYFPDIKFNKNNTAQLVKWFSNFREFYYIQMEKYARQAISEGLKTSEDLHVAGDSELYRVLNLHYNRNNHIEVPPNFRYVVEQTLREFFRAIQGGKDTEQSWKKSIYKVISRLDDPVPEYFKSPNFLEQLE